METGTFFNNKLEKEKFLSLFELSEIPNEIKDSFWDIYYRYEGTTVRERRNPLDVSGFCFCFVEHARLELATS